MVVIIVSPAIAQLRISVKVSLPQPDLKDLKHRRPSSHDDRSPGVGKLLRDGPAVASGVGDSRDERDLACVVVVS